MDLYLGYCPNICLCWNFNSELKINFIGFLNYFFFFLIPYISQAVVAEFYHRSCLKESFFCLFF